ncbi:hypothetical protein Q604_UNBC10302G0001, partial [human gut metagenome]
QKKTNIDVNDIIVEYVDKIEKEIFKAFSASNIPLSLLNDNNIYLIFVTYDYSKIIPTFTCDMVHY